MTSVSSQSGSSTRSGGGAAVIGGEGQSHNSHSVLAEVHHSTDVLRQRIEEIEQQRQIKVNDTQSLNSGQYDSRSRSDIYSSQDNAMYVPEVEFEDAIVGQRSKHSLSSPSPVEEVLPTTIAEPELHVSNNPSTMISESEHQNPSSSSSSTTHAVV